jgi:hypothetical protein
MAEKFKMDLLLAGNAKDVEVVPGSITRPSCLGVECPGNVTFRMPKPNAFLFSNHGSEEQWVTVSVEG